MHVNVVKVAEDSDFTQLRQLCDNHEGWTMVYDKKTTRVWTKPASNSDFQMIKLRGEMTDVCPSIAYDVLHDTKYRSTWDKYMLTAKDVGLINPNNDICYYALGGMPPFRNRDFVLQRSWLDVDNEKYIISHSVCHSAYPPSKSCVRATVYLTGFMVRALHNCGGCQVSYITHSDPKGRLPTWLVNRMTKIVAPKLMKKMHRACRHYLQWKANNEPDRKPWSHPEQQINSPRIQLEDCIARNYDQAAIDESTVKVNEAKLEVDED